MQCRIKLYFIKNGLFDRGTTGIVQNRENVSQHDLDLPKFSKYFHRFTGIPKQKQLNF